MMVSIVRMRATRGVLQDSAKRHRGRSVNFLAGAPAIQSINAAGNPRGDDGTSLRGCSTWSFGMRQCGFLMILLINGVLTSSIHAGPLSLFKQKNKPDPAERVPIVIQTLQS